MRALSESRVLETALKWLTTDHYQKELDIRSIRRKHEAEVSKNALVGGRGTRADGLIAAVLADGTIFTASLEAKSIQTRSAISPKLRTGLLWFLSLLVGGSCFIVDAVVGRPTGNWCWQWAFPTITSVLTGVTYIIAMKPAHSRIGVITQVKQYPADERWIALSRDAYDWLQPKDQEALCKACAKNGIGLLQVSPRKEPTVLLAPKPTSLPKRLASFLDCYACAEYVRTKLYGA